MQWRKFMLSAALASVTASGLPVQLAAQQPPRYKFVVIGTFGGPNSFPISGST